MAPKLQLKPGAQVLVVNPPGPAAQLLGPLPEGAGLVDQGPADAVVLFVRDRGELARELPAAAAAAAGDRVLWIAYPKGSSGVKTDLNRDVIRIWVESNTDLRTVAQTAVGSTWSALRLRETSRVGR